VIVVLLAACAGGAPAASRPGGAPPASSGSTESTAPPPAQQAASSAPAAAPPPPVTLKMAGQPSIPSAPRYVAIERGYFREEGIELEMVPSTTSAQTLPSLAAGQIDIGVGGATSGLFNAIAQGIPVRMVLDMWTAYRDDKGGGLIVRKDLLDSGQVRDFRDLLGLRVAIASRGHQTEYVLDSGLAQAGLSVADVETTELSYPDMTVALGNRNVDAAVTIEPYASQAVMQGLAGRFKTWPELVLNDNPATIMFSESLAEGRADVARRFAKAYVRGLRDYNEARTKGKDREAVSAIILKHVEFLDRAQLDQIPWPAMNPDGRVNAEGIAAAQNWFFDHGYVQTKVDIGKAADNQFADYAVAQLGPYQP
jgi:NitT/TauT family transport system substrate-binding protein